APAEGKPAAGPAEGMEQPTCFRALPDLRQRPLRRAQAARVGPVLHLSREREEVALSPAAHELDIDECDQPIATRRAPHRAASHLDARDTAALAREPPAVLEKLGQ